MRLVIEKDDPFNQCALKREPYAQALYNIINDHPDGFVLAINNAYGTGKTTFLEMFKAYIELKEQTCVYFNAWENDFTKEPLVAFLAELKQLDQFSENTKFDKVINSGAWMVKTLAPVLLKALADKYIETDTLKEAIKKLGSNSIEVFAREVDQYLEKKKGLVEFREELQNIVNEELNKKPLVIIVDELDRCRPDYAVEILEVIKHFFSVENIVFILAFDEVQLESSICGYYGSENFNAKEYLRRFIDLQFMLPKPKPQDFLEYLYFRYDLKTVFGGVAVDFENTKNTFVALIKDMDLDLRQIEKMHNHLVVSLSFKWKSPTIFPETLVILIYLKIFQKELYNKIKGPRLSSEEINDSIFANLKIKSNHRYWSKIAFILLLLNQDNKAHELADFRNDNVTLYFTPLYDISKDFEWTVFHVRNWYGFEEIIVQREIFNWLEFIKE